MHYQKEMDACVHACVHAEGIKMITGFQTNARRVE